MKPKLSKHTLLLFAGDYEALRDRYPEQGAAIIIRSLIRNFLAKSEVAVDLSKLDMKGMPDV